MIKKVIHFFWSLRVQFIKYFLVGISGVILDLISLIFLKEFLGIVPVLAVIINQSFLILFNFILNKYWSFRNTEMPHKQFVRYVILSVFNYIFSIITMYIFNHIFDYDYRAVRICSIAVMVSWNFFLYKYWVFTTKKEEPIKID